VSGGDVPGKERNGCYWVGAKTANPEDTTGMYEKMIVVANLR